MKNKLIYGFLFLSMLAFTFVSCEEEGVLPVEIPNAISFNAEGADILVEETGTTYAIEVQSTTVSNTARTITAVLNTAESTGLPAEYNFSGTITIPAGETVGSETISFNFSEMPIGPTRTLVFDLELPDDGTFLNTARATHTIGYTAVCPLSGPQLTTVSFTFDPWPEELSWSITNDANGLVVATGTGYDGLTSYSTDVCLISGNYTFTIEDAYGDGGALYELTQNGNVVISGGPAYGTGESQSFSISI
ncbi:hypothetical protein [Gelatiniphilus marinus]|uniref:DUF1735 domain-containing protein n=1 Tax=Gelatiniphilus marinus TaxID=1759464 RepID=A0ABW5JTK8_9FLAO